MGFKDGIDYQSLTIDDIKKAFRRQAHVDHPDKGGDEEKFKDLLEAYKILSIPEYKEQYDMYGDSWLNNRDLPPRSGGGRDNFDGIIKDIFDAFTFKLPSAEKSVNVSLDELYNCAKKYLKINRPISCIECGGNGGTRVCCPGCFGSMKKCVLCEMKGFIFKDACAKCDGKGFYKDASFVTIHLNPGIDVNKVIEISGVDKKTVRIYLNELDHEKYTRSEQDLYTTVKIPLINVLNELNYKYTHLDNNVYILRFDRLIKNNDVFCIPNMGLPINDDVRGKLYIKFIVEFPDSSCREFKEKLLSSAKAAEDSSLKIINLIK